MKKIKRKKSLIISIMLLIVSTTTMTSYAYFNSKVDLDSVLGADGSVNTLGITNGKIDMDFATSSEWNCLQNPNNIKKQSDGSYLYTVTSTQDSPKIEYGPLKLSSGETNLTKNVDLSVNFNMNSDEITTENPAESFEVMVGDIDNFGKSGNSPYSGKVGTWHNMDVFPEAYDANGTDRRMVVSGFYDYITALSNGKIEKDLAISWKDTTNIWESQYGKESLSYSNQVNDTRNWIDGYNGNHAYYCFRSAEAITINGNTFPKKYPVTFEGYTDRALRGGKNNSGEYYNFDTETHMYDGKKWTFLQKVEPITFKYTVGDGKIESAVFQVYFDDLQSGDSVNDYDKVFSLLDRTWTKVNNPFKLNRFVAESTSRYKAYIQVANSASTKVEVPEISRVINSFNQSGPCGNMVTFSLPNRLLHYIKDAAGLNNGLQLVIDDTRVGTSGDSYCIDFAKLTVNETPIVSESRITISGNVKDYGTGNNITNCNGKIVASDGSVAKINNDGSYSIDVCAGVVYLTFNIDGYEQTYKSFGHIENNQSNVDVMLKPFSQSNEITVQLKIAQIDSSVKGSSQIDNIELTEDEKKYIKSKTKTYEDGKVVTTIEYLPMEYGGVSITSVHSDLGVKPNTDYEISYTVQFASQEAMSSYKEYDASFSSVVKAKATQENNLGWDEDGTGENYKPSYTSSGISKSENNNTSGSNNNTNAKTKIYFENPIHINGEDSCGANWWQDSSPIIKYYDRNRNLKSTMSGSKVQAIASSWYLGETDIFESYAQIKVYNQSQNKNSGDLYYFITKNIFICTNGYNAPPGTVTINYVDNDGNPISQSETLTGKVGEMCNTSAKDIDGYILADGETENKEVEFKEGGNTITYKYQKAGTVIVRYIIESNIADGQREVFFEEKLKGKIGTGYQVETPQKRPLGYVLNNNNLPTNISGNYSEDEQVVEYKFIKKDNCIVIHYKSTSDTNYVWSWCNIAICEVLKYNYNTDRPKMIKEGNEWYGIEFDFSENSNSLNTPISVNTPFDNTNINKLEYWHNGKDSNYSRKLFSEEEIPSKWKYTE